MGVECKTSGSWHESTYLEQTRDQCLLARGASSICMSFHKRPLCFVGEEGQDKGAEPVTYVLFLFIKRFFFLRYELVAEYAKSNDWVHVKVLG